MTFFPKRSYMPRFVLLSVLWLACSVIVGDGVLSTAYASKYAAIVVHADTGKVLHSRRADSYRYPASITKVMTLYMLFDAIESGRLNMDSRLKVSHKATRASPSKLYMAAGDTISVRDAIGTLITKSANDVAVIVAEALGKSEHNFAKLMTAKARSIGMKKTTFRNASGLHNSRQRTTARDIATLAERIRKDFPRYYPLFSLKSYRFRGQTYVSHNKLLRKYPGMEGMKTGFINASGFNLVAVAKRNEQRLITVVMGGRTGRSRDTQVTKLMDLGFSRVPNLTIVRAPLPRHMKYPVATQTNVQEVRVATTSQTKSSQSSKQKAVSIPKVMPRQETRHAVIRVNNREKLPSVTKMTPEAPQIPQERKLVFTVVTSSEPQVRNTIRQTQPTTSVAQATTEKYPLSFTIIE